MIRLLKIGWKIQNSDLNLLDKSKTLLKKIPYIHDEMPETYKKLKNEKSKKDEERKAKELKLKLEQEEEEEKKISDSMDRISNLLNEYDLSDDEKTSISKAIKDENSQTGENLQAQVREAHLVINQLNWLLELSEKLQKNISKTRLY